MEGFFGNGLADPLRKVRQPIHGRGVEGDRHIPGKVKIQSYNENNSPW